MFKRRMFKRRTRPVIAMLILAAANSAGLLAPAALADGPSAGLLEPPNAVPSHHRWGTDADAPSSRATSQGGEFLRVQYLEATADPVARADEPWRHGGQWDGETAVEAVPAPVMVDGSVLTLPHQHHVIQAPRLVQPHGNHAWTEPSDRTARANPAHPLPHLIHHHTRHVAPAVIPDGTLREVWKSPFSYGYFGASGSRRWIRHFGYRDRDTEWRLR